MWRELTNRELNIIKNYNNTFLTVLRIVTWCLISGVVILAILPIATDFRRKSISLLLILLVGVVIAWLVWRGYDWITSKFDDGKHHYQATTGLVKHIHQGSVGCEERAYAKYTATVRLEDGSEIDVETNRAIASKTQIGAAIIVVCDFITDNVEKYWLILPESYT